MNNIITIKVISLTFFALLSSVSEANDLGSLEPRNFKAFRDASIASECVKRNFLPKIANKHAYDRIYALDPKAASLLDSGYGVISIYLGEYLNKEFHKNVDALNYMSEETIKTTCKFTNLRNMSGGTNPSFADSVNAHVADEVRNTSNSDKNVQYLIGEVDRLNSECRGGSGDNPKTFEACDKRDSLYKTIESAGWCYGENSSYGYQKAWNPCLKNKE